jgi:hypothetical protein
MKLFKAYFVLSVSLFCVSSPSWAQQTPPPEGNPGQQENDAGPGQGSGGHPPQPPFEAFTACEGKANGATASFTTPHGGTLTGVCQQDQNGKLVLRPEHHQFRQ